MPSVLLRYLALGLPATTAVVAAAMATVYGGAFPGFAFVAIEAGLLFAVSVPILAAVMLLRRRGWAVAGTAFISGAVAANLAIKQAATWSVGRTEVIGFVPVATDGVLTTAGFAGYATFYLVVAAVQFGTLRIASAIFSTEP